MKLQIILAASLQFAAVCAAFGQQSGQITYEIVRKIDPSGMRIMVNGEQVKPGDPNFPSDAPDTRTFGQKVLFTEKFVKENRDEQNTMIRTLVQDPGMDRAPQTPNMGRPFEEQIFVDLTASKLITLLTVGKEEQTKIYKSESPLKRAEGWQLTDQTRKIAGYTCRKATLFFRKESCSVWFTTELPLNYSPIHELTPEKGVVLLIESSREQVRATKVNLSAIKEKDVEPPTQAQTTTPQQLADIREKAMADFRQQLMIQERN
ncbi:GLPGLI family protein [Dyadobacter frigoris]|uniref:GLPGLI family protein n=1 Tax=Dyadobacter frigoris TaxID=2576211 RepID=A0A4U6D1C8_9BACT|nr:GLPGLI family protein [Dyadobacter frigoris]TKT87594.1 GLPGLI family protein [Dyadobacter frigoris]GLU52653.1 hypothetical protein Dfri01_21140 [Dyadobacter frigoris]